jgi:membrane protease YdiL (CAAX protease family)
LALAGLVWVGLRQAGAAGGGLPLALFFNPQRWWLDAALGLGAGAALIAAWDLAGHLLPGARQLELRLSELLGDLTESDALALAVLSGFAEELFFRGAVQGSWGLLPATLLFAVLHTGPGRAFRVWTLFAGVAGLALGGLMVWRGNLLAPVLAHFLVNAVNLRRLLRKGAAAAGPAEAEMAETAHPGASESTDTESTDTESANTSPSDTEPPDTTPPSE